MIHSIIQNGEARKNMLEIGVRLQKTRGIISNIFMGAGIAYAISREKYSHIAIPILFPSAYVGYNVYKNRELIYTSVKEEIRSNKHILDSRECCRQHS